MAFDGLVVRAVVHELAPFVGGRIHKIHQPNETDFIFTLRGAGRTRKLLVSANPTYPRFHLTERSYVNPLEAPMFCMLLRKYCENAVIEGIEQEGMERIVRIHVRHRDELGDIGRKTVIFELMGRHSNLILTDPSTGNILEAARRVTPAVSAHRIVAPGAAYVPPPHQNKRNPLQANRAEVEAVMEEAGGDPERIVRRLVDAFEGIGPLSARAIIHGAADPAAAFLQAMERMAAHQYEPNIVEAAGGSARFGVVALPAGEDERRETFGSVSACLEQYYGDKAERDLVRQRTSDLAKLLANERSKNEKKLGKLKATLAEAKDADRYRILGELLQAHMHSISKGDLEAEVVNYYDEEQRTVRIPLDPQLTPSENAQKYFRKYQKMKNSLAAVEEQIRQAIDEIAYAESLLAQLDGASLEDIDEIREELVEGGYLRRRGSARAKRAGKPGRPSLHAYLSSEDVPIYVGRNNTQNDYITNRLARPNDTWLHAKDMPGSHVLIRSESFGDATLAEAANLAAYFSKGKQSSLVPVDYTLVRHVKKPSGAKPGFVIYEKQKTLFVTPDEAAIRRLRPLQGS